MRGLYLPRTFRRTIAAAVNSYADLVPSHLPQTLVRQRQLPETAAASSGSSGIQRRASLVLGSTT